MDIYQNWTHFRDFVPHIEKFEPFLVREAIDKHSAHKCSVDVLNELQKSLCRVDVSCISSIEEEYHGSPSKRESLQIKVRDFIECFRATKLEQHHWLLELGMHFYLSQCAVYSSDPSLVQIQDVDVLSLLPSVIKDISNIEAVNIWLNINKASSTLHYDANHNFLMVIDGCKHVLLISPSMTEMLQPFCAFCDTPNHSNLSGIELKSLIASLSSGSSAKVFEIDVCCGDILFIPEGWWHQVRSDSNTVAVNGWFLSCLTELITKNSEMLPYFVRAAAHQIVELGTIDNVPVCPGNFTDITFQQFLEMITSLQANSSTLDSFQQWYLVTPSLTILDELWIPCSKLVSIFIDGSMFLIPHLKVSKCNRKLA